MIALVDPGSVLAEWNHETDVVTVNWPKVFDVAEDKTNPLRGMAKILLAARDTGRNDPLPGFVE
jgi:hypothetical protein